MENLVFVKNEKVLTDSLRVAEAFNKRHDQVLRDIRNLGCSLEFRLHNYAESKYINSQNKEMPMYLMNKKGFTLLAMGYTGAEAMKFKEAYINEFERMEESLKSSPKVLNNREQLIASMKLTLENSEEITAVKTEVAQLKEQVNNKITLDHGEQQTLNHSIKKRVESIAGDYVQQMTKQKIYSQIHTHLRRAFAAPSYRVIKQRDFKDALAWINAWRPLL